MNHGALNALTAILDCDDPKTLIVAMEGIKAFLAKGQESFLNENGENTFANQLELCGGVDKIENLQMHHNHNVYEKAVKLLETFYSCEAEGADLMQMIQQPG